MSKFLSIKKLFDGVDFKSADRIQRMYMHLMAPEQFDLRDSEDKYLDDMKKAWSLMTEDFRTQRESRKLIMELIPGRNVSKLIRDTEALFGKLEKVNIDTQASIYRTKLIMLARKAEQNDDIEEARKCIEALMKLDGIDGKNNLEKIPTTLPQLELTTDPKALTENIEADDAEIDE